MEVLQFQPALFITDRRSTAGVPPVQQASKIELAIDLKTAGALGLSSSSLLVRADRVIE
jgi:hypothetical protein